MTAREYHEIKFSSCKTIMLRIVLLLLISTVFQSLGRATCQQYEEFDLAVFDKMFEKFDVDSILRNHRLVDSYLNCFINSGHCTHLGSEAKVFIPDIIRTRCGTCGENQKRALRNGLKIFIKLRPTDWERFLDVYDPNRTELPNIRAFIEGNF